MPCCLKALSTAAIHSSRARRLETSLRVSNNVPPESVAALMLLTLRCDLDWYREQLLQAVPLGGKFVPCGFPGAQPFHNGRGGAYLRADQQQAGHSPPDIA